MRRKKNDRKVAFSRRFWVFDNGVLFVECVHTQIKRAYELSVCIVRRLLQNPDYRADGCAWRKDSANIGQRPAESFTSDWRVQFSFHIVEIS